MSERELRSSTNSRVLCAEVSACARFKISLCEVVLGRRHLSTELKAFQRAIFINILPMTHLQSLDQKQLASHELKVKALESHLCTYSLRMKSRKEINKQNYQRNRDSIKAKYSPAQHKLHTPQYNGNFNKKLHTLLLRGNLSTSSRNQQVPKRSAMSSFVIVVLDLHLHLTKQTSSFQLRSENR